MALHVVVQALRFLCVLQQFAADTTLCYVGRRGACNK